MGPMGTLEPLVAPGSHGAHRPLVAAAAADLPGGFKGTEPPLCPEWACALLHAFLIRAVGF